MLSKRIYCLLLISLTSLLGYLEPALANKFETIGSGVSGSPEIKLEYLRIFMYSVSLIMLAAGALSIMTRDKNTQSLNYTMWRSSSLMFFLLALGSFGIAVYL